MRRALVSLNLLYLPMESLLQLQKIQYLGNVTCPGVLAPFVHTYRISITTPKDSVPR